MAMGNAEKEFDDSLLEDEDGLDDDADENEEDASDDDEDKEEDEDSDDEGDTDDKSDDEEDEDADPEKSTGDKKVDKIVALKREVKRLQAEAKARIEAEELKNQDEDLDKQFRGKRDEMLDDGYSEKDVDSFIEVLKENAILKAKQDNADWEKLKVKYPSIGKFKSQIAELQKTLPNASKEDIYLTKFSKESAFDTKTRIQQEMLYKSSQGKGKGKSSIQGKGNGADKGAVVKLSKSDEGAYQVLKKSNPSMTPKQFKDLLEQEELT